MSITLTKCPQCHILWPEVSEQGAAIALKGCCLACIFAQVKELRDSREQAAGYSVTECPTCWPTKKADCPECHGIGFVKNTPTTPPDDGETITPIFQG